MAREHSRSGGLRERRLLSRGEPPAGRLDQPRETRSPLVRRPHYDPEAFGNLSEHIARFIGTGRFLFYMTVVVVAWIGWNAAAPPQLRFDPYPFIFLTLALSLQASYAAPLILLAQNRQADRDRVQYEQDRARRERSVSETEYITREIADVRIALGEVATRDFIRSELAHLASEMAQERNSDGQRSAPGKGT